MKVQTSWETTDHHVYLSDTEEFYAALDEFLGGEI